MEIIVVLIIIAVLAAALIPSFVRFAQNARASTAIAEARVGMTAAQAVVTEILASGGVLDTDPTGQILNFGAVDGVPSKFTNYLTGDVSKPDGFSAITVTGLRVSGITYLSNDGYSVVIAGGNATATRP